MTKSEYQTYQAKVARFLASNSVKPGCHGPAEEQGEPFFSWQACECCGSKLGGNRETFAFITEPNFARFTADICEDCVYFLAYGQLDDMTMLEMEDDQKPHASDCAQRLHTANKCTRFKCE